MEKNNIYCYICGFDIFNEDNGNNIKFGYTCPCCGYQYGIDDTIYGKNSFIEYRNEWIKDGLHFMDSQLTKLWSLREAVIQFENLKKIDFDNYFLQTTLLENKDWTHDVDLHNVVLSWDGNK